MTTLNNDKKFLLNSSTGSDTLASGLGPATAVYGSTASVTAGDNSVTGIDTTGISAGDVIWLDVTTSTNRAFNIVTSIDSSTELSCDYNWSADEYITNWACGGKRATLTGYGSLLSYAMGDEYSIVLETDAVYNASFDTGGGTDFRNIISDDPDSRRTISVQSSYFLRGGSFRLRNLKIQATGVGNQYLFQHDFTYGSVVCRADDVIFSDDTNSFYAINDGNILYDRILDFDADSCIFNDFDSGVFEDRVEVYVSNSLFRGGAQVSLGQVNWEQEFVNCIFDKAAKITPTSPDTVTNNLLFRRCIFNRCGSLFLNMFPQSSSAIFSDFSGNVLASCFFGANSCTGGDSNYAHNTTMPSTFTNTTTLANDPLVDGANNDANIDDSVAGEILRAINFSSGSNSIYPYRNFVTDDFGGNVIVIED